jgi:hypothetical protein
MNDVSAIGVTVSLPEPPVGWFDYEYNVLRDGSLALLRADRDIHAEYAYWRARQDINNPLPKLWDGRARISIFDGSVESEPIEVPLSFSPIIDRLADGRWLLTATSAAPEEANGRLYAPDGTAAGAIALGDGIEHVRCAADGTIWVGYFDEGVFSGQSKDGSWPISSSGIARFASDGTVLWSFNARDGAGLFVSDCYSLTLNGNTLWSCFYTDFPIVRVDDGTARHWSNTVQGAKALASDVDHVLLAGGYGNDAGRIALLRLEEEQARYLGQVTFQPPQAAGLVQGEGKTLHIVEPGNWTRIDVAAVRAALGA